LEFLKAQKVTLYAIDLIACDLPWLSKTDFENNMQKADIIRSVCVAQYPKLKVEWARFQLGWDWIEACTKCTGWSLLTDFRDVVFQTKQPFAILESPKWLQSKLGGRPASEYDLLLVEEWAGEPHGYTNTHWFSWQSLHKCYGSDQGEEILKPYKHKPVVCSGTVIGTRSGLQRYARVITEEFYALVERGETCVTPNVVDQAIHIQLWYHGRCLRAFVAPLLDFARRIYLC
jgi:hypothetical protein